MTLNEKRRKLLELKDADFWFNKGVGSYEAGQLVDSLDFYRQAIVIEPNHVPSLFNMAVIFDQLQQFKNSVRYFSRCSESLPQMEEALIGESQSHLKTADYEQALRCIDNAISILEDKMTNQKAKKREINTKTEDLSQRSQSRSFRSIKSDCHYIKGLILKLMHRYEEAQKNYYICR